MKTYLITPAFCKAKMLEGLLSHLYKNGHDQKWIHVVLDNHYPVNESENSSEIKTLCEKFNVWHQDSHGDLGMHHSINRAIRRLNIHPEDLIILCDPDDRPQVGFETALAEVLQLDPTIAVAALSFRVIHKKFNHAHVERQLGNHRVWYHPHCEMWNVAAYQPKFISDIGYFSQTYPYWGGLESSLFPKWRRRGMSLVYLPDVTSEASLVDYKDPELIDPEYQQWKDDVRFTQITVSFDEWLKMKKGAFEA